MKRRTTDQEREEFKKHINEPRPLRAILPQPKARKAVSGKPTKLDGNTAEKLRRGQVAPGARLDLHGMTQSNAHDALLSFLAGAQGRGVKLALVITGVGNPNRGEETQWMQSRHGALKSMVPRWLNESAFAALHVGTAPAHRRHGGDGALYVYLRAR